MKIVLNEKEILIAVQAYLESFIPSRYGKPEYSAIKIDSAGSGLFVTAEAEYPLELRK